MTKKTAVTLGASGILILIGAYVMSQIIVTPLSGEWLKMFKAPSATLTAYAKGHPLHLSNVLIKNQDISKSHFVGARFEHVDWDNSIAQYGSFTDSQFIGGEIDDTSFSGSTLTNVTFENVTFNRAWFASTTLNNVTFKHCKIYGSELHNLVNSKVDIIDSQVLGTELFDSRVDLHIENSTIDFDNTSVGGSIGGLKPGSKVTIVNSTIKDADFTKSNLSSFVARESNLNRISLNGAHVATVELTDSRVALALTNAKIGKLNVHNISGENLSFAKSSIDSFSISGCKNIDTLGFFHSHFSTGSVSDCNAAYLFSDHAVGKRLTIRHSTFASADLTGGAYKHLTVANLDVTKDAKFAGIHADEPQIHDVTFAPGAKVDLAGSNIPLRQ